MTLFWVLIVCAAGMVLAQDVAPGSAVYHYGWYNAIDIALIVLAAVQKKRDAIALAGGAVLVFAGAVSGLMGPDTHTVAGAPGASVRDDDAGGFFVFPLNGTQIRFARGRSAVTIGEGRRYTGGFVFWQQPRDVVYVRASDLRGNHLTITQPVNASFLSPVLLMQQPTTIAGMDVRFDTFAVPAKARNVRAVLFAAAQTSRLHTDPPISGPAVLFDVSTSADRALPGGIGIVPSGSQKRIGDLLFAASVAPYPAVVVASAPYVPAAVLGVALCVWGAARNARRREA